MQDRKPDVVRLNKAGDGLIKICGKQEICQIKQIINYYNSTIADIKNYLNDMSLTNDEALQESAEVWAVVTIRYMYLSESFSGIV